MYKDDTSFCLWSFIRFYIFSWFPRDLSLSRQKFRASGKTFSRTALKIPRSLHQIQSGFRNATRRKRRTFPVISIQLNVDPRSWADILMYEIHVQRGRKISVRAAGQPSHIDIIVIALLETWVIVGGVVCVCERGCALSGWANEWSSAGL